MVAGIRSYLWILILLILLLPFLFNAVAVWQVYGQSPLNGPSIVAGLSYNLWTDLLNLFWPMTVLLGLLAWLTMFTSTRAFLQRHLAVAKPIAVSVLTLLTISASGLETWLIDIQQSSVLRDGVGPGFAVSPLVWRDVALTCLTTTMILLCALWLSKRMIALRKT